MLLPQGQFAEFLRADAEKRRGLLESLFDTGRFTAVERWLVARRQEAARSLDEADQRLREVLARIAEAAAVEVPDEVLAAGAAEPWLAQLLTVARDERASAQDLAAGAADRHAAAAATLETAALRAEAHTRRVALRARLARLEAEAPRQAAAAAEVEAARSVAPLLPLVTEVARLQAELEQARVTARSTQVGLTDQLRATGTDQARLVGSTLPAPRTLETVARGHRDEAAGLATLTKDEAEADRLAQATDAMLRSVVELDEQSHQLAEQLAASGERRGLLEAARERSQAAVAGLPGSRAALDAARVRLAAGQRRDELARDLVAAADLVRSCTDLSQTARERWLGLRQARLDGMAAELAAGLSPGADCPVCGSVEHPRPAAAVPGAVDRQQEDAAAAVLAAAEERRVAAAAAHAACELELSAARAGAGGDVPLPDLVAAHDTAAAELDALQARAAAATADAEAVLAFGQQHEGWLRQRVALAAKADALRARVEDDRTRLSQLRSGLDGARGDDPSVAARAARLGRLAAALEALARQVGAVEQLDDQVAAALERAERAAHGRGLDTLDLVLLAARDDAVVQQLDEARRRYDADVTSLREQLAEPVLADLGDTAPPELAGLRQQAQLADAARADAVTAVAQASSRVAALLRLGAVLRDVLSERAPLAEAHRSVDGLARLAEGKSTDNRLRMSLSGYVLAARLEQVAVSASERLSRMSGGRYRLLHTAEPGAGRARGGLHLRVLDAWTGVERDPASLSGGESFAASLALALGLADVVTAEAGGTLLETLFVDEGFGSLDEDTLDEVMGVLDGLRDGGRTVGIVSHVADLRQRVPVQLRVAKGRTGSHVLQ